MGEIAQSGSGAPPAFPVVRAATFEDVRAALSEGWRDFKSAPAYGLFFGGIYALGGLLVVSTVAFFGMSYLAYPLAAGFVLIGPFIAAGLYEVSRRLEKGEPLDWRGGHWRHLRAGRTRIRVDGVCLNLRLHRLDVSGAPASCALSGLPVLRELWRLFACAGHDRRRPGVPRRRACRRRADACLVFSLTAISFPLLLDRDVDFITAMIVSVQAVIKSPL